MIEVRIDEYCTFDSFSATWHSFKVVVHNSYDPTVLELYPPMSIAMPYTKAVEYADQLCDLLIATGRREITEVVTK